MPASSISYTKARANLAALCNQVVSDREPVVIHRRGAEDVALIPAAELGGLLEAAHLFRSPRNAERLLQALARAREQGGAPLSVEKLKGEMSVG